ncbi:MAG TPA: hypothetical protein PKB03_04395 [Baekduia sp.]|nr:hypothetical protein [Baekduia sp.]
MASKRGDRRKKSKKRRHPRHDAVVSRGVRFGPLEIFQEGLYVGMRVDPEHADYATFRAEQLKVVEAIPERVIDLREQIAQLAAPLHAFDVVFALWSYFSFTLPGTLRPMGEDGGPFISEYVAHVLLDRSDAEPLREATPEELRAGADPEKFAGLVRGILPWLPVWFTHRQSEPEAEELDPWLELRSRLYMHRLTVRSFSYQEQEQETLHGLFDDFAEELRGLAGFDLDQALRLMEAVVELPMLAARARAERARGAAKHLEKAVAARRSGRAIQSDFPDEYIQRLAHLPAKRAALSIEAMTTSWAWLGNGRDAAFSAEELAEAADVAAGTAQRFLDAFSVRFGQRSDRERWEADPLTAFGGEMEAMREHPILHDGSGAYLPCSTETLFFGLRDHLTDALKRDSRTFKRYDRHRARTLEERALRALTGALNADWSHGGVKYWTQTEDGAVEEGEADGVLRADCLLIFVETKAGALAPSARRAAPERLERGLRDLVEAAAEQLRRAARAIAEKAATKITDPSGAPLSLDVDGVTRVLRIAVTLEDLSSVAPATWRLQQTGLLASDETAPWIVGIHELELICDLVDRPAQLVHYVLRRMRGNRQHVWAMDEMDYFMRYLQHGLFWEDDELGPEGVDLGNHTDPLDAWWYGEHGHTRPAPRPRKRLDRATRELLDDIEATGGPTRLEAQLMLLELDNDARRRISTSLKQTRRKTERDGRSHNMTLVVYDDFAITVCAVPQADRPRLGEDLAGFGSRKVNELGLRRWVGLGTVAGSPHRLETLVVVLAPFRLDEDVARADG